MPDFYAARELLQQAVTDRAFPGAAFGVFSKGSIIAAEGIGRFTYDASSPDASAETIFDLASVSKVLATAPLAMRLWQRGILNLEQPVGEILPEFLAGDSRRNAVTIHMLLAHTSGSPAHRKLYRLPEVERAASPEQAAERALTACLTTPLIAEPGSRAVYSDIGYILLGRALERLAGDSLNSLCDQEVFEPLELKSTCFRPALEERSRIAPTRDWEWRHRILQGEVQDENCALLGGVAGHAGVFSTVGDILKLAAAILTPGGVFAGAAVDRFTRRESAPPGTSRTLGWDTPTPPSQSGSYFSAHSVGHLGYSGSSLWIDLDRQIAVALLTNRVYTEGGPANAKIQQVRPAFHDAVMKPLLGD